MSTEAEVRLWGSRIGAVSLAAGARHAAFQYAPEFLESGIQLSPLAMPLGVRVRRFPELPMASFHGLPGLLADSLPDRYGTTLVNAWLASQGRTAGGFNAVERLRYAGARGMGALEFGPALGQRPRQATPIRVDVLVEQASRVLTQRRQPGAGEGADAAGLGELLKVGDCAGGARAKAVVAWNPATQALRSGQVAAGEGFEYWLLKLDGVEGNRDKALADPRGYGAVEYAYARMARAAGIDMPPCRLLEEGGRRHFMVRRFDRLEGGGKLHMQSLAALAHLDFNDPGAHSYEQTLQIMRRLGLGMEALEEQYRRMVFNVLARNQGDHVKNIAFLMDRSGAWRLSPAFDMAWSHNPAGLWTSHHQMSMNGKCADFEAADFIETARTASLNRATAARIVREVADAVADWPRFADEAMVAAEWRAAIDGTLRVRVVAG
ncbi:serine/threonine-protein kinase HipA [Caulobacter ginsengisoli]|uniref:Serine/threonine-protein kinase HipA n=1 Tax=Caulobacter ginsengisoli TaxID=400775 RepID=A0ABU0IX59_9CAUL|nr:HipA domain-containing protein [Caulobacter ginsengisoli]MDQ0465778.1 serine/threonine-protein kinase HipA [Caulobacter ginsengisoli]